MEYELPLILSRCPEIEGDEIGLDRGIVVIPKSHESWLNDKQLINYKEHRVRFLSWLWNVGKDVERATGYSEYTVYGSAYRTARFDRWRWEHCGGYSMPPSEEEAQAFVEWLAFDYDQSETAKGKLQEGVRRYNKWLQHDKNYDEWEYDYRFDSSGGNHQPQDFLSREERRKVRQAVLTIGDIPSPGAVHGEEREGWLTHLGHLLDKPRDTIDDSDWKTVDGWKEPSLVSTSLDAGLRPVEVRSASVRWVDLQNGVLRIPKQDSSKNVGNWTVSLKDETVAYLERWLEERDQYDRYADTEVLWLTARSNRYGSKSLRRLLHRLCDEAGIETANRKMSWYTIRHSVGTYMTKERGLAAAKAQLRHRNPMTTMKYDQVPVEDRRDALNRMG